MEGSALCLVFCSTLAALVSVISVLCSQILRPLRGWAIMGTPWQFALSKTPPSMPYIGFTIFHLAFSFPLGVALLRVIIIYPPGQCSYECWSNLSAAGGHQGQLWAGLPKVWTIRCALRTRYVQLLLGFVGTFGWLCWSCFTIIEMSCNRDSESDWVFLGEGISFVDRESL